MLLANSYQFVFGGICVYCAAKNSDEGSAMSLSPTPTYDGPELTAQVARAAFPNGNRYMQMCDTLGTIYADVQFADLYPTVGQHAEAPWRLALITIMPFAENLTDRQAADAVRGRIDWQYALGLALTEAGFAFSVLSELRTRLLAGAAEERLLTQRRAYVIAWGLLTARGPQRTDSTHIAAAVWELNLLEIMGETLHHALHVLAQAAPAWLQDQVSVEWFLRYGRR